MALGAEQLRPSGLLGPPFAGEAERFALLLDPTGIFFRTSFKIASAQQLTDAQKCDARVFSFLPILLHTFYVNFVL